MEQNSVVLSNVVSASVKNVSYFSSNEIMALFLELLQQAARQTLTQNLIQYFRTIQSLIFYQFLCLLLIFTFPPHFLNLVMLLFQKKNLVLKFSGRCSVKKVFLKVSQIHRKKLAPESTPLMATSVFLSLKILKALRFLLLLNLYLSFSNKSQGLFLLDFFSL